MPEYRANWPKYLTHGIPRSLWGSSYSNTPLITESGYFLIMAKIPLSAKSLQVLSCPPGSRKAVYRDTNCKGLSLEVRASGGRTWYLTYTNRRGKRHQHRLGDLRDLTMTQARSMADQCRTTVAMGGDPAEEQALLRTTPTFSLFVNEQSGVPASGVTQEGQPRRSRG